MHLLKHLVALVLVALAFSTPAEAGKNGYSTGMHSSDVEPIVKGMVAMSAQLFTYSLCFLALDKDETCIKIADSAREKITAIH
jgi:hypothetical protein